MQNLHPANTAQSSRRHSKGLAVKPVSPPSVHEMRALQENWGSLPTFALDYAMLESNRIVAHAEGAFALHFDMLRTRMLQQMRENGWRRVAITSPLPGCGKSSVALNLALSLSRQSDLRTVLLDFDLRRPSLAGFLGLTTETTTSAWLTGDQEFSKTAQVNGGNLAVVADRQPSTNAAAVINSRYLPVALREIEDSYSPDVMVIDTPPMLLTPDVMAIARHVDCVLLVAGAGSTKIGEIDICERDLASQTNFMGIVLNKCHHMNGGYGGEYY